MSVTSVDIFLKYYFVFAFLVVRKTLLPFQKRLEQELKKTPKLRKFWNLIKKNDEKMSEEARMQYVTTDFFSS